MDVLPLMLPISARSCWLQSEGRRCADPEDPRWRRAQVAVAVWQLGAEMKRGASSGAVAATTDSKFDFAFKNVAELFSLMCDFAFETGARSDPVDVALEQVRIGIRYQPLQSDAAFVDDIVSALFRQADDGVFIPSRGQ